MFIIAAQGKTKRRTRGWPTPHARFGIIACEVSLRHTLKSAPKHAFVCKIERGDCTFVAFFFKTLLPKPFISKGNAI